MLYNLDCMQVFLSDDGYIVADYEDLVGSEWNHEPPQKDDEVDAHLAQHGITFQPHAYNNPFSDALSEASDSVDETQQDWNVDGDTNTNSQSSPEDFCNQVNRREEWTR